MVQITNNGVMCGETPSTLKPCHPVLLIVTGHQCGDCPLARLYDEIDGGLYGYDRLTYENLLNENGEECENTNNNQG